jgi:oxygen-independent coproporphyrinogen-3 oxidase
VRKPKALMETLGVYIQFPFCASKCSFCNFSSKVAPASVFDAYCRAVEQEIERLRGPVEAARSEVLEPAGGRMPDVFDLPVDTVYLGGGTPSLLGAGRLEQLLAAVHRRFRLLDSLEFTLELTPGSADADYLARASALGVNRLSVGAQSFDDRELRSVGRLHFAAETAEMVRQARRAGFRNISLDLIAGLPYQTRASWLHTLRAAADLRPEHVSVYVFEADENSRLGREVVRHGTRHHADAVPDDEFMAEAYESAREFLAQRGYLHYEISNFAAPGCESRHNQKYWQLQPYVGLGAGAHSFDGLRRWANETSPDAYQARLARGDSPIVELRRLSPENQLEEFFFLGLRQRAGVDLALASERWGLTRLARWELTISRLVLEGWIEGRAGRIRLPERAYLVSNEIFQQFLA